MLYRTFDEYVSEIESGQLSWTPPHTNEAFWRENASKLTLNDNALLNELANILLVQDDPVVLAVACHDMYKFMKHVPNGRVLVAKDGAKDRIMELMEHPNPEVKYEALKAVHAMMTHAWYEI